MTLGIYINPLTGNLLKKEDLCELDLWGKSGERQIPLWNSKVPIFINSDDLIAKDEYLTKDSPYFNDKSETTPLLHQRRIRCTLGLIEKANLPDAKLIDIACGNGIITKAIKEKYPSYQIFGLDNSLTAIRNAGSEDGIEYVVADAFKMPFVEDIFDIAVCNNFWEHVNNPVDLALEANRVLKMGGYCIISTPSRYNFDNLWQVLRGRETALQNPSFHVTEYTVGQMKELLTKAGFEIIEVTSESLPITRGSWKSRLRYKLIKPIITFLIKKTGSHHNLETTMFISAIKVR
jgi:ubiquinone/menaquinone biosynthesis C-methylase UbiE